MTVPPLGQSIAQARSIILHVGDAEVWMPKRRMSNGVEAGSLIAFASSDPFRTQRDHACPKVKFA